MNFFLNFIFLIEQTYKIDCANFLHNQIENIFKNSRFKCLKHTKFKRTKKHLLKVEFW